MCHAATSEHSAPAHPSRGPAWLLVLAIAASTAGLWLLPDGLVTRLGVAVAIAVAIVDAFVTRRRHKAHDGATARGL